MPTLEKMKRIKVWSCGLLLLAVALVPSAASAGPADWSNAFSLQGAIANARAMVSLNPQPEPPMLPELSLADPYRPMITSASTDNPNFRILFALAGSQALFFEAPGTPDGNGHYIFQAFPLTAGVAAYTIVFDIGTSGGGTPLFDTWSTWLNPQPEPPMTGGASIAFDFQFSHMSVATLGLQIFDGQGQQIPFSAVPLPATPLLFGSGLLGLAGWRKLKKS
jgi:hypothetical protein